jgi:hypothetical protein
VSRAIGRSVLAGIVVAVLIPACATPSPTPSSSASPSAAPPTLQPTATPTDTPAPTPTRSPTAADLPKIDYVALFGPAAKLTGTNDLVPGDVARLAVLALTTAHFGVAAECVGSGTLTIRVTRPVAEPEPGALPYTELASYTVHCPTSTLETFTYDTGDPGPKTSLNISVNGPTGTYWRAILVDLGS